MLALIVSPFAWDGGWVPVFNEEDLVDLVEPAKETKKEKPEKQKENQEIVIKEAKEENGPRRRVFSASTVQT